MIQFENAVNRYKSMILDDLNKKGIKCWIAGGSIRDYFMGVPIKTDHDLFFPDLENFNKAKMFFLNAFAREEKPVVEELLNLIGN